VTKFLPGFEAVNCSASPDSSAATEFNFKVKPDLAIYEANAPHHGRLMDVSCVNIIIEFKFDHVNDPFRCLEEGCFDE
jgi:hypothetical protein